MFSTGFTPATRYQRCHCKIFMRPETWRARAGRKLAGLTGIGGRLISHPLARGISPDEVRDYWRRSRGAVSRITTATAVLPRVFNGGGFPFSRRSTTDRLLSEVAQNSYPSQ